MALIGFKDWIGLVGPTSSTVTWDLQKPEIVKNWSTSDSTAKTQNWKCSWVKKKKIKLQFKKKVEPERFNQEKKKVSLHFIKKEGEKKKKERK